MLLRLVRPMKRSGSSIPYFVQRIPADVKAKAAGMTLALPVGGELVPLTIRTQMQAVRVSLRTADPSEAKVRQAAIAAYLETVWKGLRDGVAPLSQRDQEAIAGEVYRDLAADFEENPGAPEGWSIGRDLLTDQANDGRLEEAAGRHLDWVLGRKGIIVDRPTREALLARVVRAMLDAFRRLERNAEGDYSPDPTEGRFPEWKPRAGAVSKGPAEAVSLTGLIEPWWREAKVKRAVGTHAAYSAAIRRFVAFLGHDEAQRITPEDVVRYKEARLGQVSAQTVDGDLSGLKAIFKWAKRNHKLPTDPAAGIIVETNSAAGPTRRGFTDEEAKAVLSLALNHPKGRERPKMWAAKRWVPWLCAYTGARVGEIAQLRKEDVRQEGEVWVITITPEAGTVKSGRSRQVPLHPHLVEQGFPAFVQAAPSGHLFYDLARGGDTRGPWVTVKNRLTEFVRSVVKDPKAAPNHGWRHRFITLSREHGIDQELRRMITGHKGEGVDEAVYGRPAGLYREIKKLPRYEVAG